MSEPTYDPASLEGVPEAGRSACSRTAPGCSPQI